MDPPTTEILYLLHRIDERLQIAPADIKKICEENFPLEQNICPKQPYTNMSEYEDLENQLKNQETFNMFVKELCSETSKSSDKFVLNLWKRIFTDQLAKQFSWRGTTSKKCIRGSLITLAVRRNHSIASKDQTHANTSIAHNSSISKQLIGQVISVGGTLIETAGTALKSPNNDLELNRFPSPSSVHSERFQSDPYDSPSSETTRNFHSKEDLQTFLEQKHLLVFGNFKANGKLSNIERVKISKDIIQHLLIMNPSRRLTTSELEHISELIAQVFVGELATTFYRKYIQGRHASGKLHDAYNNYRTMLAASGLITRRPKSKNTTNQLEDDEAIQVEPEVLNLYIDWGLSDECISLLAECGIKSIEVLSMMHSQDIDEIFNKRELLGEKVKFQYKMQKWRTDNKYSSLTSYSDRPLPNTVSSGVSAQESPASASTDLNIDVILSKTIRGKDVLSKYKANNYLEEADQSAIARIIVDHMFLNDIKMDPKIMTKFAAAIVEQFPTENELTYYTPRCGNKRNPSGKIHDRYFNVLYKRKRTSAKSPSTRTQAKTTTSDVEPSADRKFYKECESKKIWLSKNIPQDIELLAIWKETSEYRMNERIDLDKMLDEWPRYKDPNGPELINIDFETLHEGKANVLFEKMNDFEKLFHEEFFVAHIKDKLNLQYLKPMKSSELPLDSKHFYFFYLLHAVIQPPRIKKNIKPSISDAQTDMIVHLVNFNNFKQKEDELRDLATKEGQQLQTKIFVVGETISNLTEFYVYLNVSLTVNKLDDKKEAKLVRLLSKEVHLEKCLDAWQKTFLRRQQQLKTMPSPDIYIKQYPVLTQANGYRLLLIDAEILNRKHITLEIPPTFVQRIIGQIKSRSETVIVILKLIDMEKNENNKSIVTLMLLPYLFPSSVKKVKNGVIKMTKAECADSFICHFWDLESAESGVKKLLANHTELSPFMVFIGSPISAAWVVVGQIKYSFEDLSSCLKCAIAAYLALNIKYPQHSEKAWFFLQKYIFNISTSNDTLLENSVKTFANDLNLIAK